MAFREDRIGDCRLILGDCREVLQALPADSVHCCVTSPPYFGLRSYGTADHIWGGDTECRHRWGTVGKSAQRLRNGEGSNTAKQAVPTTLHPQTGAFCPDCGAWRGSLGLEPTPALYVEHMVEIMRGVRRVLRDDGTLWVVIGDSYSGGTTGRKDQISMPRPKGGHRENSGPASGTNRPIPPGFKPKDLIGIPWMLAFALRDDGWYLRKDCIWHKPNPMPESVSDRPTSAHEYLFLLSKSARYFYDAEAIKETSKYPTENRKARQNPEDYKNRLGEGGQLRAVINPANARTYPTRNRRSVWTIATAPFKGAHFATFPPALVEPCILAGTSERGVCSKCGAPWERVTKSKTETHRKPGKFQTGRIGGDSVEVKGRAGDVETKTIGWCPTCSCNAGVVPATVIDPFAGASTTALVAHRLGRASVSIELSAAYHDIACQRINAAQQQRKAA